MCSSDLSCDLRPKKKVGCKENFDRFLPLFGVPEETFSTLTEVRLTESKSDQSSPSTLHRRQYPVCSKHAVAGLGWLTDHGIRDHGWMTNNEEYSLDVAIARNVGRGPELYAFRNFLLQNIGFKTVSRRHTSTNNNQPIRFRILLSSHSSNDPERNFSFEEHHKVLSEAFPTTDISTVQLSKMPLPEQIELISQPSNREQSQTNNNEHVVFVTACGGGSITGFFLPRGSSMILYYPEHGGYDFSSKFNLTGGQAMLDWDLFNNLGYIRTHWLPIGSMNEQEGLDALVYLVKHEMDVVMNGLIS